ncbi:MAG: DUF2306 domain-containing protein [Caulobacteraceae bacterium]|nr:MAG: DUF2306 domain-containing protein [Caulobacteraceae bacterium]
MSAAAAHDTLKAEKSPKVRKPVNTAPAPRIVQVAVAGVIVAVAVLAIASRPHLDLLFAASPIIQIHVYAAIGAVLLGAAILTVRKGRAFHKAAGWTWVALMTTVAGASLFITSLRPGHWSWIHILSGWTLIALPLALVFVKRRNIGQHRRTMTSIYIGGLIIAGGFTFLPGRLMHQVFFG